MRLSTVQNARNTGLGRKHRVANNELDKWYSEFGALPDGLDDFKEEEEEGNRDRISRAQQGWLCRRSLLNSHC